MDNLHKRVEKLPNANFCQIPVEKAQKTVDKPAPPGEKHLTIVDG